MLSETRVREFDLKDIVYGQECGHIHKPRPHLDRAIEVAIRQKAGIVVKDVFRLIRPEAFDKKINWTARPTAEEKAKLFAKATGVRFLATILPPDWTPSQIRSFDIKRGMEATGKKGGQVSQIPYDIKLLIVHDFSLELSLGKIAHSYGLSKPQVQRFVNGKEFQDLQNMYYGIGTMSTACENRIGR